jgi:CHAT domain-containing protein
MDYLTVLLQLARAGDALRVAFQETNGSSESALRPFEIHGVSWEQVDAECREILILLGGANRPSNQSSEALAKLKRSGQLLFDLLLPISVKAKLANTDGRSLTLDVDDSLTHIPWHLLYDGREFFCRRFALGRIVNTRQAPTARSERQLKPPFTVLVLADPRGDLAAAYREGLALRNFLDQRRDMFRVDLKSYPVNVAFEKKSLRDYDIVHYAGHAIYQAGNQADSGWLLRDGTLSAGAIAAMGGSRPMPALVFANACQTGRTRESDQGSEYSERVYGLGSAFLLAGVRHYIGSLCDIRDEAGGAFAQAFYSALAECNGVGIALRQARLASIDRFGEAQLNWASYMLYGAPHFEFSSNGKSLRSYDSAHEDQDGRNNVLRGADAANQIEVKKPRARTWIAAALVFAAVGLFGYSFFDWQSVKLPAPPQAATPGLSVTNVSPVSSSPSQVPLRLSMLVIGQKKKADGSFSEIIVREGGTLRSGDEFQVHVKSNSGAYVYIILYDSRGHASKLFPDPKIEQPGFVTALNEVAIPDKHLWFWLDNYPGIETIYALASAEPLANMSELLAKMESVQVTLDKPKTAQLRQPIKSVERGVGGFAQAKAANVPLADSNLIKQVTAVVVGSGAAVRALSFRHE